MTYNGDTGGRKKFLYSGPVGSKGNPEDDQWSFMPKSNTTQNTPRMPGLPVDLDNVWSIRNVGLGSSSQSVMSEPISFGKNTSSTFYSRHGGMKGRDTNTGGDSQNALGTKTNWSSSGYNFAQGSRLTKQPSPFRKPSEISQLDQRHKSSSPFNKDINDF